MLGFLKSCVFFGLVIVTALLTRSSAEAQITSIAVGTSVQEVDGSPSTAYLTAGQLLHAKQTFFVGCGPNTAQVTVEGVWLPGMPIGISIWVPAGSSAFSVDAQGSTFVPNTNPIPSSMTFHTSVKPTAGGVKTIKDLNFAGPQQGGEGGEE